MPRTNKITGRVFADLSKTPTQLGANERFLNLDDELNLPVNNDLKRLKQRYSDLSKEDEFVEVVDNLAGLEEIIIQMRCKMVIKLELRLSLSRNYIYARSLFFRRGNEINDIRVIIGKTEEFGNDFNELCIRLSTDPEFLTLCVSKLEKSMDMEIEKNMLKLNVIHVEI